MEYPKATPDQFKINEKFFRAMPRLSIDDDERVKPDIIKFGVKDPIVVRSDMTIIDGHQRHRIVSENPNAPQKIKYRVDETFDNLSEDETIIEIIILNIKRRQLNTMQMAVVGWRAADVLGWIEEAKKHSLANLKQGETVPEGENLSPSGVYGKVAERISEVFGISLQAVKLVKRLRDAEEYELLNQTTDGRVTQTEAIERMRVKEGRIPEEKLEHEKPIKAVIPARMGMGIYLELGSAFLRGNFSPKPEAFLLILRPIDARRADREDEEAEKNWKPIPFKDWTCVHDVVGGCWRCFPEPDTDTGKRKKTSAHSANGVILPVDRKEVGGFTILGDRSTEPCGKCDLYDEMNGRCKYEKGLPVPDDCKKYRKESNGL